MRWIQERSDHGYEQPALHGAPGEGRSQHHPQDGVLGRKIHHGLTTLHSKRLILTILSPNSRSQSSPNPMLGSPKISTNRGPRNWADHMLQYLIFIDINVYFTLLQLLHWNILSICCVIIKGFIKTLCSDIKWGPHRQKSLTLLIKLTIWQEYLKSRTALDIWDLTS